MPTLSIQQLVKSYDSTPILRGVDLELERGETIVLAGVNGCGKSTLLHCIAGLVAPNAGRILVEGQDQLPLSSAQRPIGFVTQVGGYFENLSVEANLQSSLRSQGLSRDECTRRIDWILDLLQLAQVKNRLVQTLSEKAAAGRLGRGLIRKTQCCCSMNPSITWIAKLHPIARGTPSNSAGVAVIDSMVTHQFENALEQADRIALLSEGTIQQLDVPETIYRQPVRREIAYQFGRFPPILESIEFERESKTFEFGGRKFSIDSFSKLASAT
ncbi:MAG: ATP-binding cassette domain-containing protein [Pirellulales bacterium]